MKLIATFLCFLVLSCGSKDVSRNYPDNQDYMRKSRSGKIGKDFVAYDGAQKQTLVKKSNLWKASVSVVGSLFPIAVIDQDSGIIASEWYQRSSNSNRRIKINVLVRSSEIAAKNLRVSVFRQKRLSKDGKWQGNGHENSESQRDDDLTAKLIKEKILKEAKNY